MSVDPRNFTDPNDPSSQALSDAKAYMDEKMQASKQLQEYAKEGEIWFDSYSWGLKAIISRPDTTDVRITHMNFKTNTMRYRTLGNFNDEPFSDRISDLHPEQLRQLIQVLKDNL